MVFHLSVWSCGTTFQNITKEPRIHCRCQDSTMKWTTTSSPRNIQQNHSRSKVHAFNSPGSWSTPFCLENRSTSSNWCWQQLCPTNELAEIVSKVCCCAPRASTGGSFYYENSKDVTLHHATLWKDDLMGHNVLREHGSITIHSPGSYGTYVWECATKISFTFQAMANVQTDKKIRQYMQHTDTARYW